MFEDTADAQRATNTSGLDQLQTVARHMARLKVSGIPRNYELFYQGLYGHDPALLRDVKAIGANPSQHLLDQIGLKHRLVSHCGIADEVAHREAASVLRQLTQDLASGLEHGSRFMQALEVISTELEDGYAGNTADLKSEIDYLRSAAQAQMGAEDRLREKLADGIERIAKAERKAGQAKTAALRDRVTSLPNRIAFNNRLEALYAGDSDPKSTALIIVGIDRFQAMAQSFGDAAVNRLMKSLSAIVRRSIKKNDFVARTGADEFSFLFDDVSAEDAEAIAERLFTSISDNLVFATDDPSDNSNLTLMIGYSLTGASMSAAQLLAQAQEALKATKGNRRNPIAGHPAAATTAKFRRSA